MNIEKLETIEGKVCTKCGEWKTLDEFNKKKTGKYGKQPKCRECQKEYNKQWSENNKEYRKEYKKQWRENNPEYYKNYFNSEQQRQYREANKEYIKEYNKQWYKQNKEHRKEYPRTM